MAWTETCWRSSTSGIISPRCSICSLCAATGIWPRIWCRRRSSARISPCRNLLCDHRRKRRRHADGDPPERADSAPTPEERLLQREELIALYRAIARLSEDEQELLNLFYFARRPLSEIAQLTGMTPGAAKTRLYRARRHLRREEDGYGL